MTGGAYLASSHLPMEDRDLDDAALWAVIDSAAASIASRGRGCAAAPNPIRNPRNQGEIVQSDHRPQKIARLLEHEMSPVAGRQMVVPMRALAPQHIQSPATAFSSPDMKRIALKEVQVTPLVESPPPPDRGQRRDKDSSSFHCLSVQFPSISQFKQFQNAAFEILDKTDYTMISGNPYIKKSGWRKIAFFFNISFEIKDKVIEYDDNMNVLRAEFVARAYMQGGRFCDGWGSCDRREKRFQRPNNDVPSTAETRAKNRACQDLIGIGVQRPGMSHGSM